jgi:Uncharacterised nucleotidyltransferase
MQLPPPATVHAALRTTTERLAAEAARPQASPPDWSAFEWRTARAVAAMHGISGLLAARLRWRGPEGWAEFLRAQREHTARRELRIDAFLGELGERLRAREVAAVALKGAALRAEGLYAHGERPMADLDLLVPASELERAGRVLEAAGMCELHRTVKHRVYVARAAQPPGRFGEHAANDMKVELHERICEPLPLRLTDISQLVLPRELRPGLNPYPSRGALMAHLLLHAAGGMAWRVVRLIQLHDIALLAARLGPQEWQELLGPGRWWAWPPLALAERYYGTVAPRTELESACARCTRVLRRVAARQRLCDVSLSRLWIEAFPGIEWARSIPQALAFMTRRALPAADLRADRELGLKTDFSLAEGDWGRLPHFRRILRLLHARTPRPWPLYNVRAALAQPR